MYHVYLAIYRAQTTAVYLCEGQMQLDCDSLIKGLLLVRYLPTSAVTAAKLTTGRDRYLSLLDIGKAYYHRHHRQTSAGSLSKCIGANHMMGKPLGNSPDLCCVSTIVHIPRRFPGTWPVCK